jgi:hypothetical protein
MTDNRGIFMDQIFNQAFMDRDSVLLAAELVALFVLCALGLWRIRVHQRDPEETAATPRYDMRRDGQRQVPSV